MGADLAALAVLGMSAVYFGVSGVPAHSPSSGVSFSAFSRCDDTGAGR